MFKVLIVDDEPVIRKGIKNVIDWESMGCAICGEASDGIEGMDMIKELRPDIVITDIKMPGVDGLEMIRETKEIIPDGKIIILTGFRDFEYLQEAIKLGAFDYLLKPSKIPDITSIIKRAVDCLKKCANREEEFKKLKLEFESKLPALREKLLYDVMFKIICKEGEIQEQMKMYSLEINSFVLIIIETDEAEEDTSKSQYEKQLYQFGIINAFEESFREDYKVYNVPLNNRQIVFIVQPNKGQQDFADDIYKNIYNLRDIINSCFGLTITAAVSSLGSGVMNLPDKIREASEALEYKFYMGKDSIILYQDIKLFYRGMDFSILESQQKALIQSVRTGNEANVKIALKEIQSCINEHSMDGESLKNYYWNLINTINSIAVPARAKDDSGIEKVQTANIYNIVERCKTINELNLFLEHISLSIASKVNSFNHRTINSTLQRAIDYINVHYQESITLNDTAEHTYVSTFYLSRMFTKELGKNFIDYLNEIRIEKAKEFLLNTNYKTYEVAEMVGVRDAHYFSKLFKKYTGVTPSEYKDINTADKGAVH